MNKLIFLDVDGVLNNPGDFQQRTHTPINKNCLNQLARIVNSTGAQIVVSSSWRYSHKALSELGLCLQSVGLRYIDITPRLDIQDDETYGDHRVREISRIVDKYTTDSEPIVVVLDDMPLDGISLFIHVDGSVGLTAADADKAIKHLLTIPL